MMLDAFVFNIVKTAVSVLSRGQFSVLLFITNQMDRVCKLVYPVVLFSTEYF